MSAQALEQTLRGAFPGAGLGVMAVAEGQIAALPQAEYRAVLGAVFARQREFAAGRIAARKAQNALGLSPQPIPMAADRAPVWPKGLWGSISHAGGFAAAVVSLTGPLGVDMEPDQPLAPDLWPIVLTPAEMNEAEASERKGIFALEVFVAKEAAYKAQYPLTNALFDFQTLETVWNEHAFSARFTKAYAPFACGDTVEGSIHRAAGLVIGAVQIRL